MIVDASSVGHALLPDEHDESSERIIELIEQASLVEPAHWSIECAGLILKAARRGRVSGSERLALRGALSALIDTAEIELSGNPMRAFDLAILHNLSVYDAAYLDLALRTGYPLLTGDKALAKAADALGLESVSLT